MSFNVEEEIVKKLALLEPYYDIFLSYSHFNEDFAKKVVKELRIYQPDVNIFIDTAELKAGGAWQQALYEAIGNNNNNYRFFHALCIITRSGLLHGL